MPADPAPLTPEREAEIRDMATWDGHEPWTSALRDLLVEVENRVRLEAALCVERALATKVERAAVAMRAALALFGPGYPGCGEWEAGYCKHPRVERLYRNPCPICAARALDAGCEDAKAQDAGARVRAMVAAAKKPEDA